MGCSFKFIPSIFSIYRFTHFDTPLHKHGPFSDLVLDQTSYHCTIQVDGQSRDPKNEGILKTTLSFVE